MTDAADRRFAERQLASMQESLKQDKEKIALRDAVLALQDNAHYKKLFTEHYFKKHAARLVCLKAAPAMQDPEQQKFMEAGITAIGHLDQFILYTLTQGDNAERAIAATEQEIENICAEYGVDA